MSRLDIAGDSVVGRRYPANFDVLRVMVPPDRPALVVADGMGDSEGASAAGQIAVAAVERLLTRVTGPLSPDVLRDMVAEAQLHANAAGARLGQLTGCTLTALILDDGADPRQGWITHLGDSRVYRLRSGLLELLTTDHTMAWLGAVYGWFPAFSPQAEAARYRLLRYVGHSAHPEPDVLNVATRPGDVYCVCSDGLAEQVTYEELARWLSKDIPASRMVNGLLVSANAAGGRDNATAAVLRVGTPAG